MKGRTTLLIIAFFISIFVIASAGVWLTIIYPQNIISGNGEVKNQDRDLEEFTKIVVSDSVDLRLIQSTQNRATVFAEENIVENILTSAKGDTLYIEFEKLDPFALSLINPSQPVKIDLYFKNIISITAGDSVEILIEDRIRMDTLNINLNESATASFDVFVNKLQINVSGASKLNIIGAAGTQNISVAGSSTYVAGELESKVVDIRLSGTSSAVLRVDTEFFADLNGTGSIGYYGSPDRVTQSAKGGGRIMQLGR